MMNDISARMDSVDSSSQADNAQQSDGAKDDPNKRKINVRKRTKTGCMTCRKRRIKCDEGRPICQNCTKSKRHCEGYNQRVVFKDPYGTMQSGQFGAAIYPPGVNTHGQYGMAQMGSSAPGSLQAIAPKPQFSTLPHNHNLPSHGTYYASVRNPIQGFDLSQPAHYHNAPFPTPILNPLVASADQAAMMPTPQHQHQQHRQHHHHHYHHYHKQQQQQQRQNGHYQQPMSMLDLQRQVSRDPGLMTQERFGAISHPGHLTPSAGCQLPPGPGPGPAGQGREGRGEGDDASPAGSDDEDLPPNQTEQLMSNAWRLPNSQIREVSGFSYNAPLVEYLHSPQAEGLGDSALRSIFMHFVHATSPVISLFERHPADLILRSDDAQREHETHSSIVSTSYNLWSFTWPSLAFHHPALLHAMLALASLQLSKLQGIPSTAAMKHYHIAIRRLAKNVNSASRRSKPATLAATLLLSYFEVWSSDHTKWSNHLYGASILFKELRLRELSRTHVPARRLKISAKLEQDMGRNSVPGRIDPSTCTRVMSELKRLDFQVLAQMTGSAVSAQDWGLASGQLPDAAVLAVTDRDIEEYEALRDLFWWYTKMDIYQSILGGAKLFMDYKEWTQCPPRGPVNEINCFGTWDHLMLLLGRLCTFTSKDLDRKRKQNLANGTPTQGNGESPPFPGMMPTSGTFHAPRGFTPPPTTSPPTENLEADDPEERYHAAKAEWESILEAFQAFPQYLGEDYQPLPAEYANPRPSPFGVSLQYKSYRVASIWMSYHMGLVHLHRSHPDMPPAAVVAAGVALESTKQSAMAIGKIAAGLTDNTSEMERVSGIMGAAIIESAFPLFVAAIQFRDKAQRHWMVMRMFDLTRLTGWQSAIQIAKGCEFCWLKTHELGRGPAYESPLDLEIARPFGHMRYARRIDKMLQNEQRFGYHSDENQLVLSSSERAHFAIGLLTVESDLELLSLRDIPWHARRQGIQG